MKKIFAAIIALFILFPGVASAQNLVYNKTFPLPDEKLSHPVYLGGICEKVKIVEWRATPGYVEQTKITDDAIKVVNTVCNIAVKSFYRFMRPKAGYHVPQDIRKHYLETSLSFIPADVRRGGRAPRSLNDLTGRFSERHDRHALWGFYQDFYDRAYLTNDVLDDYGNINNKFVLVVAHEMFHAMSYSIGTYYQHYPKHMRDDIEEQMAQEFTVYLGFGRSR